MSKDNFLAILAFFVIILIGSFAATWGICRHFRRIIDTKPDTMIVHHTDTLIFRDTVQITSLKVVERRIIDTVYVETIDSVFVLLPRERVWYKGEDYFAAVSGIQPSLDTLAVFPKTKIITNTIEKTITKPAPRWSFGITAGPGVLIGKDGQPHSGIGAVAGIQYRF